MTRGLHLLVCREEAASVQLPPYVRPDGHRMELSGSTTDACSMDELSYKAAGVDIEAGYEAVRRIKGHARSTFRKEVLQEIGSFGGLFALDTERYPEPVLISGTDGVGTKLKIAFMTNRHDTIGIDAVAYCVNDILCHGAEPLFFLDYLAVGKLDPTQAEAIVSGVASGCRQAGCALIGGETAEMPGFYQPGEYDIAGFAVGIVNRPDMITGEKVGAGDVIVGIRSTGLQSSGFSLVRKVVFEKAGLGVDAYVDALGCTVGEELLRPTGIYARPIADLVRLGLVHGIANISGGGLPENLPRSMADETVAVIERGSWPVPPVFTWLQEIGALSEDVMWNTFNMGIAMALILPEEHVHHVMEVLGAHGEQGDVIGRVETGPKGVRIV